MTEQDREPFAELLADVFTYYREPFTPGQFDIYWAGLRMYDLAVVREAFGRHAKNTDTGQFRPKIADLERMLAGSTKDAALVAVSKFEEALKRVGTYSTAVFDDPLIHRVVDEMGGWIELGRITSKDWEFRRNEFVARYRAYKARGEVPPYAPKLLGIFDAENGREDPANLRLIGDPEACAQVVAYGIQGGARARVTFGTVALAALKALPKPAEASSS